MSRQAWFWSCLVLLGVVVTVGWLLAPDEVPLHFGPSGEPTRTDSPASLATTFGVVGIAMAVNFGGLAQWLPRVPASLINLPRRQHAWWTAEPDRLARLRTMLAEDLLVFGAATLVFLSVLAAAMFVVAHGTEPRLGPAAVAALFAYLGFTAAHLWYLVRHRYAVPEGES